MDRLHQTILKTIERQHTDAVLSLLEKKLITAGLTLNKRQRNALRRQLQRSDLTAFEIPGFRDDGTDKPIDLTITESDIEEFEKRAAAI